MMEQLIKALFLIIVIFLTVVLVMPDMFPFTNLDEAVITIIVAKILEDQFGMNIV